MENKLLPTARSFFGRHRDWISQQDGTTAHTADSVKKWFQRQHITLLPWSARSPDLNPIKNIWSWMDKKLSRQNVKSIAQMKLALEKIWNKIPKELCMHLIESMPKRIQACVKACGGHTKY